jgi:hypothetical protein
VPESTAPLTTAAAPRIEGHSPQRGIETISEYEPAGPSADRPTGPERVIPPVGGPNGAPVDHRSAPTEHQLAGHGALPQGNPPPGGPQLTNGERMAQCTAPQLRRFIKSRPYVPMHELRRRFNIDGDDDDVTPVRLSPGWVYVGLPNHEGHLLGELLRTGEIGYELSLDPRTPIVIGVYPMRPIPRN